MDSTNLIIGIASLLLGGGSGGLILAVYNARREDKKREAEAPERHQALTLEGSAKAVLTMDQALEAANERAAAAESDVKELREEIRRMKSEHRQEIDELRAEHKQEIVDLSARFDSQIAALQAQVNRS